MTPLIKLLIAIIIIYFLVTAFMKLTKWTLKAAIIVLVIAIFIFGYTSVSEMFDTPPSEKIKERINITKENITEQEFILELTDNDNLTNDLDDSEILLTELEKELNNSELQ